MKEHIARAVAKLPDDQREVFLMREVANLPFKEIAEITGVPENTVKSRMRYALERLQEALGAYEDYARALR
jgi:RNA polymerase sigma-70 factor (ECF subfamily)